MDEIEFTKDGITLRESITAFGETKTEEKIIEYTDRDSYEIDFDVGGYVSLGDIVNVELSENGSVSSIFLQFDNSPMGEAKVRPRKNGQDIKTTPPVPDIEPADIEKESRQTFYNRMKDNPNSQPATVRRHIHSEDQLTQEELMELMRKDGREPSGSGISQSLVVLEKVTKEIKRQGRGDSKSISWIGES